MIDDAPPGMSAALLAAHIASLDVVGRPRLEPIGRPKPRRMKPKAVQKRRSKNRAARKARKPKK